MAEAPLEDSGAGLVPQGPGWFVLNAREARWIERPGRGHFVPFTGWRQGEGKDHFPQLGVNLAVLQPGEPMSMYHWEADAEGFFVVGGEALLIVEGEERPLHSWDFFHCPPGTPHTIVGAGRGPCAILAVGARERQGGDDWGGYTVEEAALRHGAGVEEPTTEPAEAYGRFPGPRPTRCPEDLLPER